MCCLATHTWLTGGASYNRCTMFYASWFVLPAIAISTLMRAYVRTHRRALNHVKALFDKRVPAAEEAALALEEAANTLFDKKSGGYSSES